mmetsp:Transcript_16492/g.27547  ORF Transcript_16492/g.27547 Transcript_16492/m.27547 type:complete len:83 (+) Transcript_16492:24-272(+)
MMDEIGDNCSVFCHHNWRWVIERALSFLKESDMLKGVHIETCTRTKSLPSYILLEKVLRRYSLFRVELFTYSKQHLACAWVC